MTTYLIRLIFIDKKQNIINSTIVIYVQGLALSGVEATHIKEEIVEKMQAKYSHVTKKTVPVNDSCGAVFTAFKEGDVYVYSNTACHVTGTSTRAFSSLFPLNVLS